MKTILLLLALLLTTSLHATTGGIHGRVLGLDASGNFLGIIAGAKIELQNESGTALASATSSDTGFYTITGLTSVPYRYRVTAAGFRDEDEERGFSLPEGTRDYVHDFLLTQDGAASTPPAPAQSAGQPAVHGRVYGQDEKGQLIGPLPGAKIEFLSGGQVAATGTAQSPSGYYEVKSLAAQDYQYRVTAAGFMPEDQQRGFSIPKDTREYVHDFLLTKPPLKTGRCDLPVLVVKKFPTTKDQFIRMPLASAQIVLQPLKTTTPAPNQPFQTDTKGEALLPDMPEGDYLVAIDAPECEAFTGTLKIVCDMEQVIFELKPCNEILHSYVRVMLHEGWGSTPQCKIAAERACKNALRADDKNTSVDYAMGLCALSAGDNSAAQTHFVNAIRKKSLSDSWDHACGMRLWLHCLNGDAKSVMSELPSLIKNHYGDRPASPAAQDTAAICGMALGMLKGPWQAQCTPTSLALLEREVMMGLSADLRQHCTDASTKVATEFAQLKSACDAAREKLVGAAVKKRNEDVAAMTTRQQAIQSQVATLDPDLQRLSATLAEFDRDYRVQAAGLMGMGAAGGQMQVPALTARAQQVQACMMQDQINMQSNPAILAEIQQHQIELQQINQQINAIRLREQQVAVQLANMQAQHQRNCATIRAEYDKKAGQRTTLAAEFDRLEAARTAPFDPSKLTTPEIDDLQHRQTIPTTYRPVSLELRRETLLSEMDCGAAKDPKRILAGLKPIEIQAPARAVAKPAAAAATAPALKALPVPSAPAAANMGDAAELIVNNTLTSAIRVFTLPLGVETEQLARQLNPGEEAVLPAKIGQTFIVRDPRSNAELQRHQVGRKIDKLKLSTP